MTIKELVNSLNVGDKISYIKPKSRGRFDQRTGIIVQILEKFITVDLGKYRDSLEICDIANGHISILDAENNPIVIEKEEPAKPPEPQVLPPEEPDPTPTPQPAIKHYADLTTEEVMEYWETSEKSINAFSKMLLISWPTAKTLLKKHGIIPGADNPTKTKQENAPAPLPIENTKQSNLEIEPETTTPKTLAKHSDGTINWSIMWPIIEAELAKGRDKYEIADEWGIGHKAMASKIRKIKASGAKQAIPSSTPEAKVYTELRGKSREELQGLQAHLIQQGIIIDIIISCIDATLQDGEKEVAI